MTKEKTPEPTDSPALPGAAGYVAFDGVTCPLCEVRGWIDALDIPGHPKRIRCRACRGPWIDVEK